ncbi:ComEA family DNA-binding protein [Corynebacterium sp. HMSC29G08]|uniref:ComEA family DNA-binding protein n=1 Tax=Corynebacterium sp. HMSC29G08 TaxID=1581069 RepID=UPI0008A51A3C|nr:ComEA family DNA-binding protein [Corynebacterium sp. HMSC29G08]OFT85075.1 competence protein ComEA [Corynebacterium sp. HMSC29G08]
MNIKDRIKELTRPTGEEDALAVEYPAPRFAVGRGQAVAVASISMGLVGAWAFTRPPAPEPPWETPPEPAEIVVSVVGEVEHPGLVTLAPGARVADALAAAVPKESADLLVLNQAQLLVDAQQILVQPSTPDQPPMVSGVEAGGLISINTATAEQLTSLDGVGPATANAIVAHREANGPFATPEALIEVKGIGPAKFAALEGQITL